jgi:hypothetical protein
MGSAITLGIDKFEIDWGKNEFFADHSALFLPTDVCKIPYYYVDDIVEMKDGLARRLGSIKNRLNLLGYSLGALPGKYQQHLDMVPDYYPEVPISFEQFRLILTSLDLEKIFLDPDFGDYDLGEFISRYIFNEPELKKYLPSSVVVDKDLGTFFENLDPYITLRLLAENENNIERFVQWRYADVVDGGWVDEDDVVTPLPDESKILIVTEGSTDSFIIKRAIESLYPDIADFFHFVDMKEHYPFTGTGNLFNFCQGLARIKIQNNVLVVFDNDAAGVEKYNKAILLNRPKNMIICKLPDHESFNSFESVGPNGLLQADINGSAVAIECFLDSSKINVLQNRVRWTSYNRELGRYQGELEGKDDLVRIFKNANLTDGSYDTSRLKFLLEYLMSEWIKNAT